MKEGDNLSKHAAAASQKALEMAGLPAEDIDLIILATSTPDDLFGSAGQVSLIIADLSLIVNFKDTKATSHMTPILIGRMTLPKNLHKSILDDSRAVYVLLDERRFACCFWALRLRQFEVWHILDNKGNAPAQ